MLTNRRAFLGGLLALPVVAHVPAAAPAAPASPRAHGLKGIVDDGTYGDTIYVSGIYAVAHVTGRRVKVPRVVEFV